MVSDQVNENDFDGSSGKRQVKLRSVGFTSKRKIEDTESSNRVAANSFKAKTPEVAYFWEMLILFDMFIFLRPFNLYSKKGRMHCFLHNAVLLSLWQHGIVPRQDSEFQNLSRHTKNELLGKFLGSHWTLAQKLNSFPGSSED